MAVSKVLCVDDSDTDLKHMQQVCADAGFIVLTATSGAEAVAMAKSEQPDAILLDVMMPDMNGFQACRAITSDPSTKDIAVILVSSKGEATDRVWGEEQGARGYVTKPYTPDQLLSELRSV